MEYHWDSNPASSSSSSSSSSRCDSVCTSSFDAMIPANDELAPQVTVTFDCDDANPGEAGKDSESNRSIQATSLEVMPLKGECNDIYMKHITTHLPIFIEA
jgi:hypothetical protein